MTDSVTVIAGVAIPKIGVLANVAAPTFDAGDFSAFGTTDTRAVISGGELFPARAVFLRL